MASRFPVVICVDDDTKMITVNPNWSMATFYKEVAAVIQSTVDGFDLKSYGCLLARDGTLKSYKFYPNERVTCHRKLTSLPGCIELSTDECCVTGEADPGEMRAKIVSCGCTISIDAMEHMCNATLSRGDTKFSCPKCDVRWDFFVVRHVLSARKSAKELDEIGAQLEKNFLKHPKEDIRRCPSCQTWSTRDLPDDFRYDPDRITCSICTRRTGRTFEFCWSCGLQWKGDKSCGNAGCDRVSALEILTTCGMKQMFGVSGCPDVRACPRCGQLMSHEKFCKIMTCITCKVKFCFICLRIATNYPKAPCGDANPYGKCDLAPRQTVLPYSNWQRQANK